MTKRTARKWALIYANETQDTVRGGMLQEAIVKKQWYLVTAWFREIADALDT